MKTQVNQPKDKNGDQTVSSSKQTTTTLHTLHTLHRELTILQRLHEKKSKLSGL